MLLIPRGNRLGSGQPSQAETKKIPAKKRFSGLKTQFVFAKFEGKQKKRRSHAYLKRSNYSFLKNNH